MAKIGDVKVSDGGTIYWAKFLSVVLGAPTAAYFLGVTRTLQAWVSLLGAALGGVRSTVVGVIRAFFAGIAAAFKTSQDAFLASIRGASSTTVTVPSGYVRAVPGIGGSSVPDVVQLHLGPFTFLVAAVLGVLSMWAFIEGIRRARRGLYG